MNKPLIYADKIGKKYGQQTVIDNLSFSAKKGEIMAVIGHSGCGKSTLLRIIGGFETANYGKISIAGKKVSHPDRAAIMVFQDLAQLFPWQTVIDNVVWPMMVTKTVLARDKAIIIAKEYLTDMGLSDLDYKKYPTELSGGMRQRVAVARALALKPKILLMDEPFGAIDNLTRKKMQLITRNACEKHEATVIIVTHSIAEAVTIADSILIFCHNGGVKKIKNDTLAESTIERLLGIPNQSHLRRQS